ncbi:hypothetical protein GTCCBUS3UF5_38130 [Geobacillus thermoleovorans CCB_US3_UF5]|uniref:Uncharacterized protein n=2 Tax=Geobacillus thermoleovorans group TaxID=1505648 RepID=U2X2Y0_GEOKU|nr:hypothetical protein GTCCBUS3UF5_38130 [Geobacillus thermoleovorans CCB_US3_UF5]GAD12882.1 hypothetical protein GBL_1099 [Geobacillus kaustophilus GBlys]GAJ57140.1 hypothetical protein B23_0329 [Geobacillus thermoleovorans B23]
MAFARRRSCSREEAEKLVFSQLMIGNRMKWWNEPQTVGSSEG